jgi:phospholipid/cholesterol/gamma-HCH transport system permease protein
VKTDAIWDFGVYFSKTLGAAMLPPFRTKDTLVQLEFVAWQSLPVILFCVCFAAGVTIIESSFHMKIVVQNDSLVPGFASLLILRELGVVVSSLLLTSRVGAGLAAEVGSMQITEQIDALRMLGIDPIRFLVVPRLVACILGGLILSLIANLVCLYCAMLVTEAKLGYSSGMFLTGMRAFVDFRDLIFAMIKGAVFGAVIPLVSCFFGFRCQSGAEGVGLATTNSVVVASVSIIILDFCLTYLFSHFY